MDDSGLMAVRGCLSVFIREAFQDNNNCHYGAERVGHEIPGAGLPARDIELMEFVGKAVED